MGHRVTTLNVNTIEPAGNTLTIGASGDSVVIGNNDIRANTYKDAGGNTLFVSNGSGVLSSVNAGFNDALTLLTTSTFTNQATVSFTSGITSTYKEYIFKFFNINPATDDTDFMFATGIPTIDDGLSVITSTFFVAYQSEDNSQHAISYDGSKDLVQQDTYQGIMWSIGNDADASGSGELHFFNPAGTTYVKHWYATCPPDSM